MLEKETQKHIRLENLLRMLSESSFIESSIFDLESGFSIVESGFLKRESEHESGFFPSPDFLRVRVRVRVRSGFRSMPIAANIPGGYTFVGRLAKNMAPMTNYHNMGNDVLRKITFHNPDRLRNKQTKSFEAV